MQAVVLVDVDDCFFSKFGRGVHAKPCLLQGSDVIFSFFLSQFDVLVL